MALTLTAINSFVDASIPTTHPNYAAIRAEGVKLAVNYASPWFREQASQVFVAKDAQTTRFAITGRDIMIQPTPETPVVTGANTAGVAAPTVAPTLTALGSGGSLVAGTYYWGYCAVTARGDTQMSPLTTLTGVATSGRITRAAVTLLTGWAGIKDFFSPEPFSADVRLNGSAVTGTSLTVSTAPSSTGAQPFVDETDITTYSPLYNQLEPGVDADGTANALVTTLTFATAPAAGDKFRVWYTRRPTVPASGADIVQLPDEWIKNAALFYTCQLLALNHQSGDAARFAQLAAALDPIVMDLTQRAAGRAPIGIIASSWSA